MAKKSTYDNEGNLICPTCETRPKRCPECSDMVCACAAVQAQHGRGVCR
jgi:hypothetical protein